ncbi:Lrp/AsnC family transcriptional regulator [Candidatus Pacearchaeota archaeon]|nr:Lrp/AsnC family transcriptional regulator [Candidatus Pacearchaeota archaeon]
MDLDEKNKILFEHLLAYARFSIKDLANVLGVSKATVIKRIKFLEENKYISRYDAIINWQKLPFIKKVYFFKISEKTKEFENLFLSKKEVFSIISLNGLYNYYVWCFFKTKKQQKEFEKQLKNFDYVDMEINELILPKVTFFDVPIKIPLPKAKSAEIKMDKIDVAIIKYMAQGHGRDSLYEISEAIKKNYDSVNYHGKKILNSDYFLGIIAQPGENKFTIQTTCLVIFCSDKKFSEELYNSIQKIQHVQSDAIGKDNVVIVHFLSQTHVEYRETLSKILSIDRKKIKNILISHWNKIILNNRYPLEYFLEK